MNPEIEVMVERASEKEEKEEQEAPAV